jgi:hypothetical protein
MRTNRIQIQMFPTSRYEPSIPRDQFAFDSFTPTQQLRLPMVTDHATVTQTTTQCKQIWAACKLLGNPSDQGNLHAGLTRRVDSFLDGLSASIVEGQNSRAHGRLLTAGRPSAFPKKSGTGSRRS